MLLVDGVYQAIPVKEGRHYYVRLKPVKIKKKEEKKLMKIQLSLRELYAVSKVLKVYYINGSFYVVK